ncbi:MAG TPA: RsmB/NOP family class I SAM-dependent RNA methyltransferase, partial [Burkholderiaceae bacterium]|nr:RsmB/NOP family class I SAM-dependent RNA methyltransferase [Burkholderiaceae bacterium]
MSRPHSYRSRSSRSRPAQNSGRPPQAAQSRLAIRIGQVQRLLDDMLQWEYPADAVLSRWMRDNRKAGARDRAEVADAAFDVLRHLRRYRHLAESGSGPANRRLAILGLSATIDNVRLAAALSSQEQQWLERVRGVPVDPMPRALRYSMPDWLEQRLGELPDADALMAALNASAPLDLRVNLLKADRDTLLSHLRNTLPASADPQPTPYSPWGIRLQGRPPVNQWPQFKNGEIEVQDEGSQILAALVAPRRGEMVIDYCAGAGGKTLALGAMMRSTGRLYAFDVHAGRLASARPRFARSGLSNIVPVVISEQGDKRVKRLHNKAHRVLVDAPCTGVGTLRRNPDLKWRMNPDSVANLIATQAQILAQASRCVAPGGRLVYATCSLLPEENQQQIHRFLAANKGFTLVDAGTVLADRFPRLEARDSFLQLRPDHHGTDGF